MDFQTTVEIDAPLDQVWAALLDVDRWPQWTDSISMVERLDASALTPGAKVRIKQPRMAKLVWEVTELRPESSLVWQSTSMGVTTVASHRLRPSGDGRVSLTLGIHQTGPLAPVVALLISRTTRRYVQMEADGFKRCCEARVG